MKKASPYSSPTTAHDLALQCEFNLMSSLHKILSPVLLRTHCQATVHWCDVFHGASLNWYWVELELECDISGHVRCIFGLH